MSDYIQIANLRGTPCRSDYIQLSAIIGNHTKNNNKMYENDFYTLCQKDPNKNIGLRKQSKHSRNQIILNFNDVSLDYLCSDIVRFCLSIYKNNGHLGNSNMTIIPKEPISISEELKEYIEDFLPDFYGIRK